MLILATKLTTTRTTKTTANQKVRIGIITITMAIAITTAITATNKSYLRRSERCFTYVLYIGAQS